jgi:hypothetical protein
VCTLLPNPAVRLLQGLLLSIAAFFLAFHFVHLSADFPNYSPWMDWSKYTDEGWYGDAAIRHYQWGHWYVAGDFNPAAALPAWPLLEGILFKITGVSLVAARALTVCVFAGILIASWLLLRRWRPGEPALTGLALSVKPAPTLAPAVAVFLLAVNPFCFVFTRLAILEPLLILLTLLALLAAGTASRRSKILTKLPHAFPVCTLGLLLPAMILTKTTALFLFPAIFWLLFAAVGYRVWPLLRIALPAGAIAAVLWLLWFGFLAHKHYLPDYRYLFNANSYTGITRANARTVLADTVTDGAWMGKILFPASMTAIALAAISWRRLRGWPLIPSLVLWAAGYIAFLAYHNNLQPRYYLVVAVPLTLLLAYVLELWLLRRLTVRPRRSIALSLSAALIAAIAANDARQTLHFLRYPDYTLVGAAQQLSHYIAEDQQRDPSHSPLVLSISGSDLSLMTGLHSINDDFGTLELVNRVARYRPGWFAAWNDIEDDKMEALAPFYHVDRVAAFPAMDDPDRNLLILYRLNEAPVNPPEKSARKPIQRRLRPKVGQQPSPSQLQH